jgi:hypothetical protein
MLNLNGWLVALLIVSLAVNVFFYKNRETVNIGTNNTNIPTSQIQTVTTIKPTVTQTGHTTFINTQNPVTGISQTGKPTQDAQAMTSAVPKLTISPIEIIQTKDKLYIPSSVDAVLDYGYNRHYLTVSLPSTVKKVTKFNIKAMTMWDFTSKEIVQDYQLSWEVFKWEGKGINAGAGMKSASLTTSWDVIGNLDFHAGVAYTYGGVFCPTIGLSLDLF